MEHFKDYVKPYYKLILIVVAVVGAEAMANLIVPAYMADIVNVGIQDFTQKILAATDTLLVSSLKSQQMAYILKTGGMMLLFTLVTAALSAFGQFLVSKLGAGMARDIRKGIFQKVESFSAGEYDKFSTASLITRTTNDVMQIQMLFAMGIRMLLLAPLMGIGGVFMAVRRSPSMGWINGLTVAMIIGIISVIYVVAVPKFKIMQKLLDGLNLIARENLSGLMVVRAFSAQKHEEARFDKANRIYKDNNLFVQRAMTMMNPTISLVMNLTPVLIVWIAASKIAQSELVVGDMIAFIQYSGQIMQSFLMMSMIFMMIPRAVISINRIEEILAVESKIKDKDNAITEKFNRCKLEFKNVSFRYDKALDDALSEISFSIDPGTTTAIIGSTGSGKSTLVKLISRLYDVSGGEIDINGINIKDFSLKTLREMVAFVPQQSIMISGDIRENIKIGNHNASDEEIMKAAEVAQAKDFIMRKENGLDDMVSQGGANFSGGQRQRLSIARAVAKQSPIYIFDDSFSALDFKTDSNLRKALKTDLKDAAIIIVGQRVASIKDADQILVIDEGRIVGKGRHSQLLENCEEYLEIAQSQLSLEEM